MADQTREEIDARIAEHFDQHCVFKELAVRADDPFMKREYLAAAERQKIAAHALLSADG